MADVGRPSDYKEEYNEQARKLCLLGAKDTDLADFFGVCEKTINNWKSQHPEFLQSIKDGKENADVAVVQSLYKTALEGNTTAQIFWLKNRQPSKWRDKTTSELVGKDDGPIQTEEVTASEKLKGLLEGIAERSGKNGGS